MKTSESVKNIAPALLKAQTLIGGAKKGANNPFFKSKYADLGAVLEACKDILNDNKIVILQPHTSESVETILLHESGEWVSSETRIIVSKQNDPQAQGSAISYARRYGLQSLLSMPAEDDDGEGAMNRQPKQSAAPAKAPSSSDASPTVATTVTATPAAKSSFKTNAAPAPKAEVAKKTTVADDIGW